MAPVALPSAVVGDGNSASENMEDLIEVPTLYYFIAIGLNIVFNTDGVSAPKHNTPTPRR